MSSPTYPPQPSTAVDTTPIAVLYQHLLDAWNRRDAEAYAAPFDQYAFVIGFDGTIMNGRAQVESDLTKIFAHHETSRYVGKVKNVQFVTPDTAVLLAVSGMVKPGQSDLDPSVNTIQTLVAVKRMNEWRIALFQNTPAQFHGRPELAEALTNELRQLL